ncbi:hypothetical protein QWU11_39295 [Actinomadura sp. DC4]|nr:hypothetical protein [Actinomadura sp. DC4]MDN3358682.1 hypothetical protein [Actinomadura sp. DC4]
MTETSRRSSTGGSGGAPGAVASTIPATASAAARSIVSSTRLAGDDRAEARVQQGVVRLADGVRHPVMGDRVDRYAHRDECAAVGPADQVRRIGLHPRGRVRDRRDEWPLDAGGHRADDLLGEGRQASGHPSVDAK